MNVNGAAVPTLPPGWIVPDWPAPPGVHAFVTTRSGGVSPPPWGAAPGSDGGMNLGLGSGDARDNVLANRARLRRLLPAEPVWLQQVHGAAVVDAEGCAALSSPPQADASTALAARTVCAVLVADCLPVLIADRAGRAVAAAHAGWRGLAAGVLQRTVARLRARLGEGAVVAELVAWLGPAIGARRFEVGAEVLDAMQAQLPQAQCAFAPQPGGKYLADLHALARQALAQCGVVQVHGDDSCTFSDAQRFFSYRRDGSTGRHVAVIWRDG